MTRPQLIQVIHQSRLALLDITEEMGGAADTLREANNDEISDNREGALICLDDATGFLSAIEQKASETAAIIARAIESARNS